ncbi:DUF6264 family protein [Microbacterium sp. 10M-3C3]|uniref:DUF6264 family protein n=1 Tax=Microbacterium sp. 10M-3C3 TaxID=2483401 RepID=UPI000F6335E0|nr:DUF6264 family protein [Microbacterium sp. 10M-3C3]
MTYAMPPESYRTLQPERRPARRIRVWDLVLTIVLLLVLAAFAALASYFAVFLAFASDGCGGGTCDTGLLNLGFWFAVLSPWVLLVLAFVTGIVLLVLRRLAFWVPLTAAALIVACFFIGVAIVGAAVR